MEKNFSREDHVFLAKMAEQSERYSEMIEYVGYIAKSEGELSEEERHIVSVAYKNVVGSKRAELRVLSAIEQKESKKGNEVNISYIRNYKNTIEGELKNLCNEILGLIDKYLFPNSKSEVNKIFFLKMKGDYNRYLAEFIQDDSEEIKNAARDAYIKAESLAVVDLPATHPLRLGLYLNYSVFCYEILNDKQYAQEMVNKTFNDAIQSIDSVSEDQYKDVTLIMQLLRDNLTLWSSGFQDDGNEDI